VPSPEALDLSGLDLTADQLDVLLSVDTEVWREEASLIPAAYERFGGRLPKALWRQFEALNQRLGR
jgi:phosphoenolpyruvate carboxykinase (GTP)